MRAPKDTAMKEMGGLSKRHMQALLAGMMRYPQIQKAYLFGSRAKGCQRRGSDIDIALVGESLERVATLLSGYLNNEAPLPYRSDVVDYRAVGQSLRDHIDRVGILIYDKNGSLS